MTEQPFEPKILAICCRHCAYAAADLAGAMRLRYPSNVRVVEVPCSGRVEPLEVLLAFEQGVDGVMVAG
jgi:coenzyme F420-reducing hydrogenase delta subunit